MSDEHFAQQQINDLQVAATRLEATVINALERIDVNQALLHKLIETDTANREQQARIESALKGIQASVLTNEQIDSILSAGLATRVVKGVGIIIIAGVAAGFTWLIDHLKA